MKRNRVLNLVLIVGLLITLALIAGCFPAEGEEEGGSIAPMIIFLVLIFGLMYFLMIRPQRKRQKEHQELMAEIRRGDKIITSGGIYGVIESTSDDNVVIRVESGATMRVARASIASKRER